MLEKLKRDFQGVKMELDSLSNGRLPKWVIVLWYIIAFPFGLLMFPFVKVYYDYKFKKLVKYVEKREKA